MKKAAAQPTTKSPSGTSDHFSLGSLAFDFLDTSWRIAVPVVLFASIGIFADIKLGSKPWLTLLGTIIGFVFAGVLLKEQLKIVARGNKDK
jgi:F0F1-type ATP synthase assembly protein I